LHTAASWIAGQADKGRPPKAPAYEVIDGDTVRAPYGVKYRLLGFDAPETFQANAMLNWLWAGGQP
jgi:endonuclease YncB( thermonuclease family)